MKLAYNVNEPISRIETQTRAPLSILFAFIMKMSSSFKLNSSIESNVKFAGEEAKDRLYEPKHKKKLVRVLTVVAYLFLVSLAAIMLSLYYVFLWNEGNSNQHHWRSGGAGGRTFIDGAFQKCLNDMGNGKINVK